MSQMEFFPILLQIIASFLHLFLCNMASCFRWKMSGLKKKIGSLDLNERRALIEPANSVFSQKEQCKLLGVARSGLYYVARQPTEETLLLMRAIDEEYLRRPYYGRRRMTIAMRAQGFFGVKKG